MKEVDAALMDAYDHRKFEDIPGLLARGADPRVEDDAIYHLAGARGQYEVLEQLLDSNPAPIFEGHQIVAQAAYAGHTNCIGLFLLHGLDVSDYLGKDIYSMLLNIKTELFGALEPHQDTDLDAST